MDRCMSMGFSPLRGKKSSYWRLGDSHVKLSAGGHEGCGMPGWLPAGLHDAVGQMLAHDAVGLL